jgi:hypothetical protein
MSREEAAVVFTAKSIERILKEGGTSSWRLDRNHARQCPYAVCTRNAHADWVEGSEPHHSTFLVGRVLDVVPANPSAENDKRAKNRLLIRFSEFARDNISDVWRGDRNRVSYRSLEELGINSAALKWEVYTHGALSLADAKRGLALTFNVPAEAIESPSVGEVDGARTSPQTGALDCAGFALLRKKSRRRSKLLGTGFRAIECQW